MTPPAASTVVSQRDVVFTPFMLRVRATLAGEDTAVPLRLRPSTERGIAAATWEWFEYRGRAEQVIAEANAMVTGDSPFDLVDEIGTGRLSFVVRLGGDWARFFIGRQGKTAWIEIERPEPAAAPVEPGDLGVLEDLLVEFLTRYREVTG
jgi:hypothetical protein